MAELSLQGKIKLLAKVLRAMFPKMFDPAHPVPLAIGVKEQVLRHLPGASTKAVRQFLRGWTKRTAYVKAALESGAVRRNIDGTNDSTITSADREYIAAKAVRKTKRKLGIPITKKTGV